MTSRAPLPPNRPHNKTPLLTLTLMNEDQETPELDVSLATTILYSVLNVTKLVRTTRMMPGRWAGLWSSKPKV